jgi:hypothetical protein
MAERPIPDYLTPGHFFDPGPFLRDLYYLLCIILGDKLVSQGAANIPQIEYLQDGFRQTEVTRILLSSASALRVLFDQHPQAFHEVAKTPCGELFDNWARDEKNTKELTLREACNKVIHATKINPDFFIPHKATNPDEKGSYMRPFLYLYGERNGVEWRAVLNLIDFVIYGSRAFLFGTGYR